MAKATADFETGVDGNNVLASDTGSATAWDDVAKSGTATIEYSSAQVAHGSLSAEFTTGSGSACHLDWTSAMGTPVDSYGRIYLYRAATAEAVHYFAQFNSSLDELICRLGVNESSQIQIQNGAGSIVATQSGTLATGQWTRVEFKIINHASAGILECKIFNAADASSPDETLTATSQNTRADTTKVYIGSPVATSPSYTFYVDDIVVGANAYPGPASSPVNGAASTEFTFDSLATGHIPGQGSGTTTYTQRARHRGSDVSGRGYYGKGGRR